MPPDGLATERLLNSANASLTKALRNHAVKLAEWKSAKRVVAIAVAGKPDSAASMLASQPQTSPALVAQPVAVTTSAVEAKAA